MFHRMLLPFAGISIVSLSAAVGAEPARRPSIPEEVQIKRSPAFDTMPPSVIGVLMNDVADSLAAEGRSGPRDVMGFGSGERSYRFIYVPCPEGQDDGEALVVPVGQKGERRKRYESLCLVTRSVGERIGASQPYNLVKVEVNDGLGSPEVESFVATRLKLLDKTEDYPLDTTAAVEAARMKYKQHLREHRDAIGADMEELGRKVLKGAEPSGPREEFEWEHVAWLSTTNRLRVEFLTTVTDGKYAYGRGAGKGRIPPKTKNEKDAPKKENEDKLGVRFGIMFGVRRGAVYEISAAGTFLAERTLPQEKFEKVLSPPP
jgi:hypothetical protein